jgi:hypothetical protein
LDSDGLAAVCLSEFKPSQLNAQGRDFGPPSLFIKKIKIKPDGRRASYFITIGLFKMTTSRFNPYPVSKFVPDIWHKSSKDEKRVEATALVDAFLRDGGQIIKAPAKKRKAGGRTEIFTKDTHAVKVHDYWNRKFLAGDDFTAKGPRFTSKPISEKAIDQRDIERKAGVSHSEFAGAVVEINGKLQPRNAPHTADEALVDMVSKGGSEKVVQLIPDAADDLSDANRRAKIRDELNLNDVDYTHNAKLKLVA